MSTTTRTLAGKRKQGNAFWELGRGQWELRSYSPVDFFPKLTCTRKCRAEIVFFHTYSHTSAPSQTSGDLDDPAAKCKIKNENKLWAIAGFTA